MGHRFSVRFNPAEQVAADQQAALADILETYVRWRFARKAEFSQTPSLIEIFARSGDDYHAHLIHSQPDAEATARYGTITRYGTTTAWSFRIYWQPLGGDCCDSG